MELLDSCIVLLMRSLLSLWWSKMWTIFRLETQRVNTLNRAAMNISVRAMCARGERDDQQRLPTPFLSTLAFIMQKCVGESLTEGATFVGSQLRCKER